MFRPMTLCLLKDDSGNTAMRAAISCRGIESSIILNAIFEKGKGTATTYNNMGFNVLHIGVKKTDRVCILLNLKHSTLLV